MQEKKKKVLDLFKQALPDMSEPEVDKLLAFGQGVAFAVGRENQNHEREEEIEQCQASRRD